MDVNEAGDFWTEDSSDELASAGDKSVSMRLLQALLVRYALLQPTLIHKKTGLLILCTELNIFWKYSTFDPWLSLYWQGSSDRKADS